MPIDTLENGMLDRPALVHETLHIVDTLSRNGYVLAKAQVPMSSFFAAAVGEMSKSKISIGRPIVVQALGI